jgi:putative transposase
MLKAFKYRLYPTEDQATQINKNIGSCRFVYNWALAKSNKAYENFEKEFKSKLESGEMTEMQYKKLRPKFNAYKLSNELTQLKKQEDTKWLNESEAMALVQSLNDLQIAYKNFFDRLKKGVTGKDAGFPQFKKKHGNKQSYRTYESTHTRQYVNWQTHTIELPCIKEPIKIILHRHFAGQVRNLTVSRTKSGEYYVSIMVDTLDKEKPLSKITPAKTIGLDLGLIDIIALSTGEKIENPKTLKKYSKKMARLQRTLSRRKGILKGSVKSNRFLAQKKKIARLHEKVARVREAFAHNLSHKLTHDNQVRTIVIEDLNVKGMLANRKLSKAISDVSWTSFINKLKYKCNWNGINLIQIDRFAPTSKICRHCGHKNTELTLKDRVWTCNNCGAVLDRDENAAINIKNIGLLQL